MATLTSIWKQCNSLRWYSEKEYYVTHATYIRGLLRNGRLAEGLAEYAFYNRYNGVNNTVNTVVLEGLTEGGFYRECILLMAALLLDIRCELPVATDARSGRPQIDWLRALATARVGLAPSTEPATRMDAATRSRLFLLSTTSEKRTCERRRDDPTGQNILLNKRAYGEAIASACALRNYDFALLLYDVLAMNHVRPRRNTLFALIGVTVVSSWQRRAWGRATGVRRVGR